MAKLHGRIRRVPNRLLTALALALGAATAVSGAGAQVHQDHESSATGTDAEAGTRASELEGWGRDLASEDDDVRRRACSALSSLEAEALSAIEARVASFARPSFDSDEAYRTINKFRHAVGSLRADENVDVIPGLPALLAEDRAPMTVALVERRLLARSLVDMASIEAAEALGDIIATDPRAWRWEWRRMVWRLDNRALPMLLTLENHSDSGVRRGARWGMREVGLTNPGRAVQTDDMRLLAELLRAYGTVRQMDAMRVVVGFVTHDRAQVRIAARWATERYGRNAIWQLRRVYRNLTGSRADESLGWEATAGALYRAHDEARLAPVRDVLEAGRAALVAGDLDTMREKYDAVLTAAPDLPQRGELAPGYAALAARAVTRGEVSEARRFYQRALRLAPSHQSAAVWRADQRFLLAEQHLAAGVADLGAYRAVLVDDPTHRGAQAFIAAANGEAPSAPGIPMKRVALAGAALMLLAAAAYLYMQRREEDELEDEGPGDDQIEYDDPLLDVSPDTLPG